MIRKSTYLRAKEVVQILELNTEKGVQRKSKANVIRNIIAKSHGVNAATVYRYIDILNKQENLTYDYSNTLFPVLE